MQQGVMLVVLGVCTILWMSFPSWRDGIDPLTWWSRQPLHMIVFYQTATASSLAMIGAGLVWALAKRGAL